MAMQAREAWRAAWRAARCIHEMRRMEATALERYGTLEAALRQMPPAEYDRFTRARTEIDMALAAVPLVAAGKAIFARANRDVPEVLTSMAAFGPSLWRFVRQLHPRLRLAAMKWPHGRLP